MFCANCGQVVEEGKPFCTNCGATAVRTVTDGGTPPPPVFTPATAPLPPPQGGPAGHGADGTGGTGGAGYGGGWQPPQGPPPVAQYGPPPGSPPGGNRTGIIVGSIVACIVVLAGLGVGLWLGLRDDGGETDSTKVVSSTTSHVTTTGGSVTTGGGTSSSSGGATTTQTIPSLNTTSSGPGTTGSTNTASTTTDLLTDWYAAEADLASEMEDDDGRIPGLAEQINATMPDVPDSVYGELSDMADALEAVSQTMAGTPVPSGFDDAHYWIMQAATHMGNRIQATMDGISLMWSTGSINSATASFDTGRTERDAYRDAIEQHYSYMPAD